MEKRTDRLTAAYVDLAFNVAVSFGQEAGLRVLREQDVPPSVVRRVLIDAGPRRGELRGKRLGKVFDGRDRA